MPTKRNRAGQQQNYVPQGNGDASGEYADEASGSNKHFTNFKKPDEAKPEEKVNSQLTNENVNSELTKPEEPKEDTSKYLGGSKVKSNFSATILSKGFGKYGTEVVEQFKEIIANANEDCVAVLEHNMQNHFIYFENNENAASSYFNPGSKHINIKPDSLDRAYEEKGETAFHEMAHWLNDAITVRESEKWYSTDNRLTDARKYFEDNKSVAETLQEELAEFAASKVATKIRAERRKFLNERLKPHGFTFEEYDKNAQKVKEIKKYDEEWNAIRERFRNDYENGEFSSVDEANKKLNEALDHWKKTGKYKDLFNTFEYQRQLYGKYQAEWGKATGMKAVSDVWSSKSDFGFGYGHPRSYYNKSEFNPEPEKLVADELWANFFGSLACNNQVCLETTKKYFPRTCEKMLKLIDMLKGKRDKSEKMKEQIERFQRGETL